MKRIIVMIAYMLTTSVQATSYGSANKVCDFNGSAMVVELKGNVLRYIIGDYAMHKPPTSKNYSKGQLMLSDMSRMNVVKIWQFEDQVNKVGNFAQSNGSFSGKINTPLTFDLTSEYGSYAPFNVYELCR